jgi:diguanylate cyclase (GGDEF)-like protein
MGPLSTAPSDAHGRTPVKLASGFGKSCRNCSTWLCRYTEMNVEMNAFKPGAEGDDTEMIRETFRLIVQRGVILIGLICLFDSTIFYVVDDPQWWWGACLGLSCIPAYYLLSPKRPFAVFFATLIVLIATTVCYCAHIALRWGNDINYHYKLLAIIPLIAVSGRMSPRMKWAMILVSTAGMVALDHRVTMVAHSLPLDPTIKTLMQGLNFGLPVLAIAALMLHYFKMVAEQQAQLQRHATTDPLTGLMNRRRLRGVWMQAEHEGRRGSFPLSIVLCDIDHFKSINDKYGHEAGDQVLRKMGQLIPREVRTGDSVCRWGGEEFLLLLPNSDKASAAATANRIRETIAATPLSIGTQHLNVTVTMGIATLMGDEKFEAAAHRADVALYAGKAAGRNRVVVDEANDSDPG